MWMLPWGKNDLQRPEQKKKRNRTHTVCPFQVRPLFSGAFWMPNKV